jgi:O-antigen ligase
MHLAQTGLMKMNEQLLLYIVYLPLIMTATVLFWLPKGANLLPYAAGVSFAASLFLFGRHHVVDNIHKKPFAWILIAYSLYAIFSYYYHGHSSREMRALITSLVFVISIHKAITINFLSAISLIASFGIFITFIIQYFYFSVPRISAFTNPNIYVLFCATISIFCLSLSIHQERLLHRLILIIGFLLALIATFMTGSRATSIAILLAIVTIFFLNYNKLLLNKFKLFLAALLILLPIIFMSLLLEKRITYTLFEAQKIKSGEMDTSIGVRFQLWSSALSIFKTSPILGKGHSLTEDKKALHDEGKISYHASRLTHFHNQFLDTLVKKGIIGLVLLLSLIFYPIVAAFKKGHEAWRRSCAMGIFVIYLISSISDVPFLHPHTIYVYVIFLTSIVSPAFLPDSFKFHEGQTAPS